MPVCYPRQHLVTSKKCNNAKTKKISQSNEHIEPQPENTEQDEDA